MMVQNSARKKATRQHMAATGRSYLDASRDLAALSGRRMPVVDLGPAASGVGRVAWAPEKDGEPHLLIEGATGSGKSRVLRDIVRQLHPVATVILCDPIKEGLDLEGSEAPVLTDVATIAQRLVELDAAASSVPFLAVPVVVVMDELAGLSHTEDGTHVLTLLDHFARTGRWKRIHVVASSQRIDHETPRALRSLSRRIQTVGWPSWSVRE